MLVYLAIMRTRDNSFDTVVLFIDNTGTDLSLWEGRSEDCEEVVKSSGSTRY